jgi:hypothetical protein
MHQLLFLPARRVVKLPSMYQARMPLLAGGSFIGGFMGLCSAFLGKKDRYNILRVVFSAELDDLRRAAWSWMPRTR